MNVHFDERVYGNVWQILLQQLFESTNIHNQQNMYKEIATNYRHRNHAFFSQEKKIPQ